MWRLNEENKYYELASWDCTVIKRSTIPGIPGDSDLGNLVQNAFPDPVMRTIIGLGICLVITFMPYLASLRLKQSHVTINIPTVLYGICFGSSIVVCTILGFFGYEILFFLAFIILAIIALMWLYGKKSVSGSES